jgi:hypothetical protein
MNDKSIYTFLKGLQSDLTVDSSLGPQDNIDFEQFKGEVFATASGTMIQQNYQIKLPDNLNIVRAFNYKLLENVDENIKSSVNQFIQIFQNLLYINSNRFKSSGHFPSLILNILEDGSALLDWGFKDYKIGFSFEKDSVDSSWFFVANEKFQDYSASGKLDLSTLENFLASILMFVANNS